MKAAVNNMRKKYAGIKSVGMIIVCKFALQTVAAHPITVDVTRDN